MYSCPNCNEETFSILDKFKSYSFKPAKCVKCGELASSKGCNSALPVFVGMFGVPVVLFVAHILKSWASIILALIVIVLASCISFHREPMAKVNIEKAKNQYWLAFYILLIILVWLMYDGFLR